MIVILFTLKNWAMSNRGGSFHWFFFFSFFNPDVPP